MKDAFKIKKGLSLEPIDPLTVQGAEAGDIIIDSTDENTLKLFNPDAGEFETISGGGGQSSTLMSDFEKLTPTVSNVVAVVDTVTFLPIDDNKKSVKATFSGSNGTIRYEVPVTADLEGVQGIVTLWIKTTVENLTVVATKDGVAQNNGLQVNSSNKWRQYEVPVVFGAADYGFEVRASGAVAGDVYIDEAFVKINSEMFIRNISGAQFAGRLQRITSNQVINTTAVTKVQFNSADFNLGSFDTTTNYRYTPERIGKYLVNYKLYLTAVSGTNTATLSVYKNGALSPGCSFFTRPIATEELHASMSCVVNIESVSDYIEFFVNSGDGSYNVIASNASSAEIYFFPDSTSNIVTQNTELTAKTANEFSANISSAGVVSDQSITWLSGNCTIVSSRYECPLSDIAITSKLNCVATNGASNNYGTNYRRSLSDTTKVVFTTVDSGTGSAVTNQDFNVICQKQGTDYNKSATIIGKFENINSSELCQVEASGNNAQALTANITDIRFNVTESKDTCNAYDGTTFTATKTAMYYIDGMFQNSTSVQFQINAYKNATLLKALSDNIAANNIRKFSGFVELSSGDTLTLRASQTITGAATAHEFQYISITELPDTESIIKNLSNQKTKCQTKYLSANYSTSTQSIPDLEFTGLTIGKTYQVGGVVRPLSSSTQHNFRNSVSGTGNSVGVLSTNVTSNSVFIAPFKAIDTALRVSNENTNTLLGIGDRSQTYITLCELPDTYVETDEW
jgi:hypothetical protein